MYKINLRGFLVTVLIILIAMTLSLLYLYFLMTKPPGNSAYETKNLKHLFSIYGIGHKESEQLLRPVDTAFDNEGNVYITDTGHSRVLVFSAQGNFVRNIGKKGSASDELLEPVGVTVADDGRTYISDKVLNKVVIYSPDGAFEKKIDVTAPLKPLVANQKLYLLTHDHIIVFDLDGRPLFSWGQKGRAPGDMDSPTGIAVGKNGNVYISDTLNLRIESFTNSGKLRWAIGQPASDIKAVNREFGLPSGLAIDNHNHLYLIDAFNSSIKVFDTNGKQLAALGKKGKRDGELNLPAGIAFDQAGVFAVADKFNNRVQLFKIILEN